MGVKSSTCNFSAIRYPQKRKPTSNTVKIVLQKHGKKFHNSLIVQIDAHEVPDIFNGGSISY